MSPFSKFLLIVFSKICMCFKLKPAAESNCCFVLGASDGKNKGDLVGLLDLNSLVFLVHFALPTETAGNAHQIIHCGITLLPLSL